MDLVQEPSWMDPIITYLKNGELPEGKIEAQILRLKIARYVLYDDKLYKRGYSMLLLKCVPPSEAEYIMKEIQEGYAGITLLFGCRRFTFSHLNPFYCLIIICYPSFLGCIRVGEFYYKVGKGLSLDCHSRVVVHIELP